MGIHPCLHCKSQQEFDVAGRCMVCGYVRSSRKGRGRPTKDKQNMTEGLEVQPPEFCLTCTNKISGESIKVEKGKVCLDCATVIEDELHKSRPIF